MKIADAFALTPRTSGELFVCRRTVLIGLLTTLRPSLTYAQKATIPIRIGWLSAGSEPDLFLDGFREGLRKLGYVEGQNVVLDIRHAHGNLEALRAGAADLLQAKVILIVASLTAVRAARAIKDIPIVYVISGDPIEAGLAKSLSRPGGNLTGSTFLSLELAGKRVELLKQAVPESALPRRVVKHRPSRGESRAPRNRDGCSEAGDQPRLCSLRAVSVRSKSGTRQGA